MTQPSPGNLFTIATENASKKNFAPARSFRAVYIVSRIFGQMPFSIAYHLNGDVHRAVIKKLDVFWFLLSIITLIYIMYFSMTFFEVSEIFNNLSSVSLVGNYVCFLINSFCGLSAIVYDMCLRSVFVDVFQKLITFDREARLINFSR